MKLNGTEDERKQDFSIRVRIDTELKEKFFEICEGESKIPSRVIRRLIAEYVQAHKHNKHTPSPS